MKKQVNKNLVWNMAVIGILALVIIIGLAYFCIADAGLNVLGNDINQARSAGEIGDVEGYGIIMKGIGYGLGSFGLLLILALFVIFPGIMTIYILTFSLIARLIYANTGGRILAYRILMGFSFSGQIVCLLLSVSMIYSSEQFHVIPLFISMYLVFVIWKGMQGTYTKRLKQ